MKKVLLVTALLLSAAGYVFLQTTAPRPNLAAVTPGGALLYLEAGDFGRVLRDWDASRVKSDWLASDSYAVFSRSNLFTKLEGVYSEYGEAAGFLPGLKGAMEMAGAESALALYEFRNVEFLYVTRIGQAQLAQSQLWAVRDKFEQRQAAGESFYLRTDPASNRTVAFAIAKGYLLLATRDDLIAQALALLAGGAGPSVASDRWYRDSVAAAPAPGELRLAMNLETLVKSTYFRSYWIQRNASTVRRYWAGVADVARSDGAVTETRVFLRASEEAGQAGSVSGLLALVPDEAGLYSARLAPPVRDVAASIVQKLMAVAPAQSGDNRYAPEAAAPDEHAGSEADLETRIDEPPLPAGPGLSESVAAVQSMLAKAGLQAMLQVQSSLPADAAFIRTPSVIVLAGSSDWDRTSVQSVLTSAVEPLWTTAGLGAGWSSGTAGRHPVEQLDGLGKLMFAIRGPLLFVGDDAGLLSAVLDRAGSRPVTAALTYAAGFRHGRERSNYERIMGALDFTSAAGDAGVPAFFSGNLASLSRVLGRVSDISVTEREDGAKTRQTVVYLYRMEP